MRQVTLAGRLHPERAEAELLDQPPARLHALPGDARVMHLQLLDGAEGEAVQAGSEVMHRNLFRNRFPLKWQGLFSRHSG
ncbi:MAG: hypothetical protein EBV32_00320 [Proteobacteria bacterium]|uniref:Uncharacterized protein n=1 Tax=Candidatus Fonsibacter lacus TaxID=2576439 RepID=A0A964XQ28_9PROT|nr:hypothetical protein [Candidatus Fonsibacter lacus]